MDCVLCFGIPIIQKCQKNSNIPSFRFSSLCLPITTDLIFLFQSEVSHLLKRLNKINRFWCLPRYLDGARMPEGAINLIKPWYININFFNSVCFIFVIKLFNRKLITRGSKFVVVNYKFCFLPRNRILGRPKKKKIASSIDTSRYSMSWFSETTAPNSPSRSELTVLHFYMTPKLNNLPFYSLDWSLDRPENANDFCFL